MKRGWRIARGPRRVSCVATPPGHDDDYVTTPHAMFLGVYPLVQANKAATAGGQRGWSTRAPQGSRKEAWPQRHG